MFNVLIIFKKTDVNIHVMNNQQQSQLLEQLQQFADVFNQQLSGTQSRGQARTHNTAPPECPGLNRVSSSRYKWTVPHGKTCSEITYCESCVSELGIAGFVNHNTKECNCDSFILKNKADNGVFNVSFWNTDLKQFYETSSTMVDGVYYVKMPSGSKFQVLIKAKGLKDQTFRYEVNAMNSGAQDEYVLHPECSVHIHDSSFIGNEKRDDIYCYVDSNEPAWDMIGDDNRISKFKVVKPCDTMIIRISMYNIKSRDFMADTGTDYGKYVLNNNNVIKPKKYGNDNLHAEKVYYDNKTDLSMPSRTFEPYTKKPLEMKFIFTTDTEIETDTDTSKLLDSMLVKLVHGTKAKINSRTTELKKLNENIKAIEKLEQEIQELKGKLKALPSRLTEDA